MSTIIKTKTAALPFRLLKHSATLGFSFNNHEQFALFIHSLDDLFIFNIPPSCLICYILSVSFIVRLHMSLQVVEIALKVSPMLGSHMFQPLLPAVFRGIVDGEVRIVILFFISCTCGINL